MSQLTQMRCDRCGFEESIDPVTRFRRKTGWATINVGLLDYDLCPRCWREFGEFANFPLAEPPSQE